MKMLGLFSRRDHGEPWKFRQKFSDPKGSGKITEEMKLAAAKAMSGWQSAEPSKTFSVFPIEYIGGSVSRMNWPKS